MRIRHVWPLRLVLFATAIYAMHLGGLFIWLGETDLDNNFRYPMEGDISTWVDMLEMRGWQPSSEDDWPDSIPQPLYNEQYSYPLSWPVNRCLGTQNETLDLRLLILIKSDPEHRDRRDAIRRSWGFERRFSDVAVRRLFLIGRRDDALLQRRIKSEQSGHGDMLQAGFQDSYFNNTMKSMVGLNWAANSCQGAEYILLCDDDMYISLKNLLRFARDPKSYPARYETAFWDVPEIPDAPLLYAGFVFQSRPHRHRTSKWFVPLSEWEYNKWPPYVTAGAVLLSKGALRRMHLAAMFTQHFRFDDVYLALLAQRAGVPAVHSQHFHFYKLPYNVGAYRYVVASHGYHDPAELVRVWSEQKSAGNA